MMIGERNGDHSWVVGGLHTVIARGDKPVEASITEELKICCKLKINVKPHGIEINEGFYVGSTSTDPSSRIGVVFMY